jgi:hypothetical protein
MLLLLLLWGAVSWKTWSAGCPMSCRAGWVMQRLNVARCKSGRHNSYALTMLLLLLLLLLRDAVS